MLLPVLEVVPNKYNNNNNCWQTMQKVSIYLCALPGACDLMNSTGVV